MLLVGAQALFKGVALKLKLGHATAKLFVLAIEVSCAIKFLFHAMISSRDRVVREKAHEETRLGSFSMGSLKVVRLSVLAMLSMLWMLGVLALFSLVAAMLIVLSMLLVLSRLAAVAMATGIRPTCAHR
jgi:hypothetical protein